jgi:hypothetical protein
LSVIVSVSKDLIWYARYVSGKVEGSQAFILHTAAPTLDNYMAGQDRCPKYPSMQKAYCVHCQRTERGTAENPRFSLKEDNYYGCPVVEVLKNDEQVTMSDSHFRFGVRKAQMLVACVPLLREFWRSSDEKRLEFQTQVIENQLRDLRIRGYVEMHPDFELSDGRPIDRPWLRLQALPPHNDHIGLGTMKCRAICEVEEDLKRWLRRQGILG